MRTNLSDLQSKGLVESFKSDPQQIKNAMENADKNIRSANKMIKIDEWGFAYTAAYNAMLHAGRALMFSKGQRPTNSNQHVAVISFCYIYEKKYSIETLKAFDQGRKRRHEFQYDDADAVSKSQALRLIKHADDFTSKTGHILKI